MSSRKRRRSPSRSRKRSRSRSRKVTDVPFKCQYLQKTYTKSQLLNIAAELNVSVPPRGTAEEICKAIAKQRPDLMRASWKNWLIGFGVSRIEPLKGLVGGGLLGAAAGGLLLGPDGLAMGATVGAGTGELYGEYKGLAKPISWKFEREHARGLMREYNRKN